MTAGPFFPFSSFVLYQSMILIMHPNGLECNTVISELSLFDNCSGREAYKTRMEVYGNYLSGKMMNFFRPKQGPLLGQMWQRFAFRYFYLSKVMFRYVLTLHGAHGSVIQMIHTVASTFEIPHPNINPDWKILASMMLGLGFFTLNGNCSCVITSLIFLTYLKKDVILRNKIVLSCAIQKKKKIPSGDFWDVGLCNVECIKQPRLDYRNMGATCLHMGLDDVMHVEDCVVRLQ